MSEESLKETDLVYRSQKSYEANRNDEQNAVSIESGPSSSQSKKEKYPKIVFLIVLNEFCERFSYYGIRTVLFIYLTTFIQIEKNTATAIYHAFTVLCYFSPLLGAIVADGYIGLYRTILYVSCLYCVGELILTLTSIPALGAPNLAGPMIGLIIIAIGTGGIKPCVSAFGGNQFSSNQKKQLATFFSIFYLSINIGSTISTIITPIFRNDVKCFGNDCYALAFGVPAVAMFLSIVFFVIGTPYYKRDDEKAKNGQNIISQTAKCIFTAVITKIKARNDEVKKDHWLDYADHKFGPQLISDVKALFKILFVFLPLPIFWALYDQQGSRWTMQAQQLDGRIGSAFTIKPDQFQAVNPIIIVLVVPLFDFVIYPLCAKINFLKRPLQRMCVGILFGIAAFIIAAILESRMQATVAARNPTDRIRVLNLAPCQLQFDFNRTLVNVAESGEVFWDTNKMEIFANGHNSTIVNVNAFCDGNQTVSGIIRLSNHILPQNLLVFIENGQLGSLEYGYDNKNSLIGYSLLKYDVFNVFSFGSLDVNVSNAIVKYGVHLDMNMLLKESMLFSNSSYEKVDYADYDLRLFPSVRDSNKNLLISSKLVLETCGVYTILLYQDPRNSSAINFKLLTDVYPSGIHLSWQLIQIFVMTIGEIMFSISGISFAYSQAPATMKSVLQAMWCMTVAFGNLIVVIIAEGKFVDNQVHEYFLFAGLLGAAAIVFAILSFFYKYHDNPADEENNSELTPEVVKDGVTNAAMDRANSIEKDMELIKIKSLETN